MDTYSRWNHCIEENDLLRILRDAASHGYNSIVVINGEYYTVKLDKSKFPVNEENLF